MLFPMNMAISLAVALPANSNKISDLFPRISGDFSRLQPADVSVYVILILFFIGIVATLLGLRYMHKEGEELEKNSHFSSFNEIKKLVEAGDKPSRNLKKSHTFQRIHALVKGAETRHIPSLFELHESTQHSELTRRYSAFSRTVASVLIICGIAGSVIGIHGVEFSGESIISALTAALKPSLWAVGCTILLVSLRGVYLHYFRHFLAKLDGVTMSSYMPLLNRRTQLDDTVEKFAEAQKKLGDLITPYGEYVNTVQGNVEAWMNARSAYLEDSKCMRECAEKMSVTLGQLGSIIEKQFGLIDTFNGTLEKLNQAQATRNEELKLLHNSQDTLNFAIKELVQDMSIHRRENVEFTKAFSLIVGMNKDVVQSNVTINEILKKTSTDVFTELEKLKISVSKVEHSTVTLDAAIGKTSTAMDSFDGVLNGVMASIATAGDDISDSRGKVISSAQFVQQLITSIESSVQGISASGTTFGKDVDRLNVSISTLDQISSCIGIESQKAQADFDASMDALKKRVNEVVPHFDFIAESLKQSDLRKTIKVLDRSSSESTDGVVLTPGSIDSNEGIASTEAFIHDQSKVPTGFSKSSFSENFIEPPNSLPQSKIASLAQYPNTSALPSEQFAVPLPSSPFRDDSPQLPESPPEQSEATSEAKHRPWFLFGK